MKLAWRIAGIGIASLIVAWTTWAMGTPSSQGAAERAAIVGKTEGERAQLQRRLDEFRGLSSTEQAKILELHRAVASSPKLSETLDEYTRFVARLDPWDRERLEEETDTDHRIAMVQRLLDDRHERHGDMHRPGWMTGETVRGTIYSRDDFQEILDRLMATLNLRQAAPAKRDSVEGQLWALQRIAAKWRSDDFKSWPSAAITTEMLKTLPDERFRNFVLQSDRFDDERRRKVLAAVLMRTLMAQWQRAVPRRIPEQEVRAVLSSFKERELRDRDWRDSDRLQSAILGELEKKSGPIGEFAKGYQETRRLHHEFDPLADGHRHRDRHHDDRKSRR